MSATVGGAGILALLFMIAWWLVGGRKPLGWRAAAVTAVAFAAVSVASAVDGDWIGYVLFQYSAIRWAREIDRRKDKE